ncbi:hypothetical protein MARPU_04775 [Marichromatium purpuratum 984]|uniref:Lysozyme inhibitor LprI N-terminal domain-containing protein n=1 Tax=Marichromatium purpuratum 984 TaxID=765910 RepID=W0E233_MARPU|nr:DUF3298 domain-containing protein [Marichromatium purpuratum]AHF03274.1 hypothetical protein MARPU_04775 [Marichromatium purpuratum 984]
MSVKRYCTAALLGIALLPTLGAGAGFDCNRASTPLEHTICTDAGLDALDAQLTERYYAAREGLAPTEREALLQTQRSWLAARNRCGPDRDCLRERYRQRIEELASPRAHIAHNGPYRLEASDPVLADRTEAANQKITERFQSQLEAPAPSRAQITRSGPHYQLEASYPVFTGAPEAINRAVRTFVQDQVNAFLANTEERQTDPEPPLGPAWSFALEGEAGHRTKTLQVIAFEGYAYYGGAHGMPLFAPLLLDLSEARALDPTELFRADSDWLVRLARLSRAALAGRDLLGADADWVNQGTAPVAENYQLLLPGPDGLTVIFPPYAVAAYAAGAQRVLIPYAEIDDLLARPLRAH